ncbi:replicative DNA helicase [Labrys sp. ZIDIC5]|uniref:replicative DNA helicase n=1 Tax=Labrys sedimenti TaxID=3106036 RepID=UPI002ACA1206|nr:DnaB-like helicase C-terminal domain-containing protein [Labrys sp. ZIDIC5]MDZ5448615.1 DnaB-like helicase C-terminal domain-containing protein [Labrys sp. ZIDIC5]
MSTDATPYIVATEQNVLGALLTDNRVYGRIAGILRPEHFADPLHQRIYEVATNQINAGRVANPISVRPALGEAEIAPGVDVPAYLVRLSQDTASLLDVHDHAELIRDSSAMRRLAAIGGQLSSPALEYPYQRLGTAFDEIDALRAELTATTSRRLSIGKAGDETLDRIERARRGEKVDVFVPTGFDDLDRALNGGWYGGDLIILAGRPGMGKTVVACAVGVEAARKGAGVLAFSLEIDSNQTVSRMIAHRAYQPHSTLNFGRITAAKDISDEEMRRIEAVHASMKELPITIDDTPRLTVSQIYQRAKAERDRLAARGIPLALVVIDYLKFVKASDRYKGQRVYEVGEISSGLKEMAKELKVAVILCAQLNRGIEAEKDKRPDLAHLRESGDLEADADAVLFLYREHYYLSRSPEFRASDPETVTKALDCENKLEMIIAKNRKGPTTKIDLFCDIACSHVAPVHFLRCGGQAYA